MAKMTKREAMRLSNALAAQLERRLPFMKCEALLAHGLIPSLPPTIPTPPAWVLAACRIAEKSYRKEVVPDAGSEIGVRQVGALVGMGGTWKAFLSQPNDEALEKKFPELAAFRARFAKISDSSFKIADAIETNVPKAPLTAGELAAFNKGRAIGSEVIVDDSGELRDAGSIKEEVSYFLWLYWEQIQSLQSLADLMKFLREFYVEGLTQQNLEKICRELGLRLKARGRPKNLLLKKRSR